MNKCFKLILVTAFLLSTSLSQGAILCPPTSCNIHNGCMDGCSNYTATGKADCSVEDPAVAEKDAFNKGQQFAWSTCAHNFFLTSKWRILKYETENYCEVRATATFSCFQ